MNESINSKQATIPTERKLTTDNQRRKGTKVKIDCEDRRGNDVGNDNDRESDREMTLEIP
jgi:hypothetical protein